MHTGMEDLTEAERVKRLKYAPLLQQHDNQFVVFGMTTFGQLLRVQRTYFMS